jgi:hypothetical protein
MFARLRPRGRICVAAALTCLAAMGCDGAGGPGGGTCTVAAGALVITEILPNPAGKDAGQEWFEVYNSSSAPVNLAGLRIALQRGNALKRHSVLSAAPLLVAPGAYAVVASGAITPAPLYSYGDGLGELSNTDSIVILSCSDGTELDRACYGGACVPSVPAPPEGQSFALILAGAPSASANDDPRAWAAVAPTPAADNPDQDPVVIVEPPKPCDGPVAPTIGSVVITEVMGNPDGTDGDREWLEIRVDGAACVDLEGVRVTTDLVEPKGGVVLAATTGLTAFSPGGYYVFAGRSAELGAVPVAQRLALPSLANADGKVALWSGSTKLAEALYGTPSEGHAQQLGDDGTFCSAPAPMPDGVSFGTPGLANPACGGCFCKDPSGALTSVSSVGPGELVITEVLADVPGKEDAGRLREWFEVQLAASVSGSRSLACLEFGASATGASSPIVNPDQACLMLAPGELAVFGRTTNPADNGGLAVDVVYAGSDLSGAGGLVLRRNDGVVIDAVTTYGSSSDGVARQVGPATIALGDPTANDGAGAWCDALPVYDAGTGARGTPGAPNHACGGCFCQEPSGGWVEASAPALGELVITEVFADVPGSETTNGDFEWFEVYSSAPEVRHLNCLTPQVAGSGTPSKGKRIGDVTAACQPVAPGAYAVFCKESLGGQAQSLGPCTPYGGPALVGSGTVSLLGDDGAVVAQAAYATKSDGVSTQLAAASSGACAYTPVDAGLVWCQTSPAEVYASFDDPAKPGTTLTFVGTPGDPNPCCAVIP